jgi:RNA polymerase sigma-70 factor (ECF subfamily)
VTDTALHAVVQARVTADSGPSDEELLERWRAGDRQAANDLLRRHFVGLRSFLLSRVHDEDRVKDLVQATMLAAVEGRDRFRGDAPFRAYLFAIARRKYRREVGQRAEERQRIDPTIETLADVTGRRYSSLLTDKDELRRLFDALRSIPMEAQDLTAVELAALEDVETSANTIKSRLRLAREKLGRRLQQLSGMAPDREIDDEQIHAWMLAARAPARRGELRPSDET